MRSLRRDQLFLDSENGTDAMSKEIDPRFIRVGTHVITHEAVPPTTGWEQTSIRERKMGVTGTVTFVDANGGHGASVRVRHDDGTGAWYGMEELAVEPQIISPEEATDLTVAAIRSDDEEVWITFHDGSLIGFKRKTGSYHGESDRIVAISRDDISDYDLSRLGYITEAEWKRRDAVRQNAVNDVHRQRRLDEWRKLNKEFAGVEEVKQTCKCAYCAVHGQGACTLQKLL